MFIFVVLKTLLYILSFSILFIGSDLKNAISFGYQYVNQSHCCDTKSDKDTCEITKETKDTHDCCKDDICKCSCCFHFVASQPIFNDWSIRSFKPIHSEQYAFIFNYKLIRADYLLQPPAYS